MLSVNKYSRKSKFIFHGCEFIFLSLKNRQGRDQTEKT